MGYFDWLRRRSSGSSVPPAPSAPSAPAQLELDLPAVCEAFQQALPSLEHKSIEPELLRARLADWCRGLPSWPMEPDAFLQRCGVLDAEGWRRLALVVGALELPAVHETMVAVVKRNGLEPMIEGGFIELAREAPLLTMEVLRQSPLRIEELARRWALHLGVGIRGESAEESATRLVRLDYGRLLGEAERARTEAEARQEFLKKLRQAQDKRIAPRGKW